MAEPIDYKRLDAALRELLACIPEGELSREGLSSRRAKRLADEIREAIERLSELAQGIDTIRQPPLIFDPNHPEVVGRMVGETMLKQPRNPLGEVPGFYGSGVYALYYKGDHPAYAPICGTEAPIYVGKADPADTHAGSPEEQGPKLAGRLRDHAKSINATENLRIADFECRYLVVTSGWQKAAEDYLLAHFGPIWNQPICTGFGKHGDAADTRKNTRSEWDTLHPGRKWATDKANKPNPKSPDEIIAEILAYYHEHPPRE
ncbi:MAG: Eco29kI family restriction endonuclease [Phycisphaeraceae bacterium]|nr:Eco29kI family restriction endonuclease [Phycisphaeraceae bacterium]